MVDYSCAGYKEEAKKNNIVKSICMGLSETFSDPFPSLGAKTPMLADLEDYLPDEIYICPGINPHTLDSDNIDALENFIKNSNHAVGIKIYAGYYHFDVTDKIYEPVYRIAYKYGIPIVIHSGDTYSDKGLLEYSHPLKIDKLAVEHRDMKIVICHMGVPWVFDSCEVAYKNKDVYLDMSGMLCGSEEYLINMMNKRLQMERYIQAIEYMDNYSKLLFGTDWPLAPMGVYIEFCKKLIPTEQLEKVFFTNALNVFNIGRVEN